MAIISQRSKCRSNVGPPFTTPAQRCPHIWSPPYVCQDYIEEAANGQKLLSQCSRPTSLAILCKAHQPQTVSLGEGHIC